MLRKYLIRQMQFSHGGNLHHDAYVNDLLAFNPEAIVWTEPPTYSFKQKIAFKVYQWLYQKT